MARDRPWDAASSRSHARGVSTGKPCASAAARRMQGAPAAVAAERHGPNVLGSAVETIDELAGFTAAGTAGDGGRLAPARIPTPLGVEELVPTRSTQD